MQKRTHEEWRTLFAEQAASGLSARQFCVQRDLCPKHFSVRKGQLADDRPHKSDNASSAFVRLQKSAPVAVPDMTVSWRHAELRWADGQWLLTDLGSTNGTRVNGWQAGGGFVVRPGDHVTFGAASFRVADQAQPG